MAESKLSDSKRGVWLTVFLVLWLISSALGTFHYFSQPGQVYRAQPDLPFWVILLLDVFSLMGFLGYLGVWKLKKLGVYGALVGQSALFVLQMIFFDGQPSVWYPEVQSFIVSFDSLSKSLGLVNFLVWMLIFGLLVRANWQKMD
jgi:hypothetical protein